MPSMKVLDSTEIAVLEDGIYSGSQLLGWYKKGDTCSNQVLCF